MELFYNDLSKKYNASLTNEIFINTKNVIKHIIKEKPKDIVTGNLLNELYDRLNILKFTNESEVHPNPLFYDNIINPKSNFHYLLLLENILKECNKFNSTIFQIKYVKEKIEKIKRNKPPLFSIDDFQVKFENFSKLISDLFGNVVPNYIKYFEKKEHKFFVNIIIIFSLGIFYLINSFVLLIMFWICKYNVFKCSFIFLILLLTYGIIIVMYSYITIDLIYFGSIIPFVPQFFKENITSSYVEYKEYNLTDLDKNLIEYCLNGKEEIIRKMITESNTEELIMIDELFSDFIKVSQLNTNLNNLEAPAQLYNYIHNFGLFDNIKNIQNVATGNLTTLEDVVNEINNNNYGEVIIYDNQIIINQCDISQTQCNYLVRMKDWLEKLFIIENHVLENLVLETNNYINTQIKELNPYITQVSNILNLIYGDNKNYNKNLLELFNCSTSNEYLVNFTKGNWDKKEICFKQRNICFMIVNICVLSIYALLIQITLTPALSFSKNTCINNVRIRCFGLYESSDFCETKTLCNIKSCTLFKCGKPFVKCRGFHLKCENNYFVFLIKNFRRRYIHVKEITQTNIELKK